MTTTGIADRTWIGLILVYLCLIYPPWIIANLASKTDFIKGDCYYYRAMIVSLLEDGDLLLANNIETDPLNGQLALGEGGLVPKHPIIMPLFSIPFYKAFGTRGLLLFNIIGCLILALLIFQLNRRFFDGYVSALTTILYMSATLFFNYVYNYSPDIFATVLLVGGLNLVLGKKYRWGALLLGLSVFAKLPNVVLAGIIMLYAGVMIFREHRDGIAASAWRRCTNYLVAIAFFAVALTPFVYVNYLLFGSPFVTGYQRTAGPGARAGEIAVSDHVNKFNQPFLHGAYRLLLHPISGLIPTNPILILALFGLLHLNRHTDRQSLYLIVAICAAQFATFAKYDDWQTSEFSNRFMMTLVACSSVLTSLYLHSLGKKFFSSR